MTQPPTRAPRADSVRNRARILDAARREITRHGPEVGMDEIARSAGVAVGTLYRHFPTKTDLVAAVVSEFLAQVADGTVSALERLENGSPAFVQLAGLLRDIVLATATNHAAKAAASALNADVNDSHDLQRAGAALQAIITAAIDEARSEPISPFPTSISS